MLVVGLVASLVAWLVLREDTYVAPEGDQRVLAASPGGAARALTLLEQAVTDRDEQRARELAAPGTQAESLLEGVVANAGRLVVRDFTARYVSELGGVDATGAWPAAVDLTWRFAGFDPAPVRVELQVTFAVDRESGEVTIAGLGGGERRTPLWLTGPLQVRRSATALVLTPRSADDADRYLAAARRAVPVVRRVVPGWRDGLVVEVPQSEEQLDAALGSEPGTYADIAALAATVDGTLARGSAVHVFVNPRVYGGLGRTGAQVVMSHEATHVATGAAFSPAPLWLLEGFADYVALREVRLPLGTTAGQILEQVRREGPPPALPGARDFEATDAHLGAVYESAWLACRYLADQGGEPALVALYADVDAGAAVDAALREHVGLDLAALTQAWRRELRLLAREPAA